jgi:hypothetical protein
VATLQAHIEGSQDQAVLEDSLKYSLEDSLEDNQEGNQEGINLAVESLEAAGLVLTAPIPAETLQSSGAMRTTAAFPTPPALRS